MEDVRNTERMEFDLDEILYLKTNLDLEHHEIAWSAGALLTSGYGMSTQGSEVITHWVRFGSKVTQSDLSVPGQVGTGLDQRYLFLASGSRLPFWG